MLIRRLALIGLAIVFAVSAAAFGPATHQWIAKQATGHAYPSLLYGAAAPDMYEVADIVFGNPTMTSTFRHLTHYRHDLLPPSPFAEGFATHDEQGGADAYAHGYRDPVTDDWVTGYVIELAEQLSAETGADPTAAHSYIELALDILMRREHGLRTGAQMVSSSLFAGPGPTIDVTKSFSGDLADGAGLSSLESSALIAVSDRAFRLALLVYGLQLVPPEAHATRVMPWGMMIYDSVDYNTATLRLGRAMQLCEARLDELDDVPAFVEEGLAND